MIASIIERTPWGDVEGSVRAIDHILERSGRVLAPQRERLASHEGSPKWLDGRRSDEFGVDATKLSDAGRLLLVAQLSRDLYLNWRTWPPSLTNCGDLLDQILRTRTSEERT